MFYVFCFIRIVLQETEIVVIIAMIGKIAVI